MGLLAAWAAPAIVRAQSAAPALDAATILRRAILQEEANEQAVEQYAWHERDIERQLTPEGAAGKLIRDDTLDVSQVDGVEYRRRIERNGAPLAAAEQGREDRRLAAFIRKQASPAVRARNLREQEKERQQLHELIEGVPEAFVLTLELPAAPPACACYVIQATPRAGYHAQDHNLDQLHHVAGTIWVDRKSFAVARLDLRLVQSLGFGWLLARIAKGGQVSLREAPVEGHWFPESLTADLRARVLVVKGYNLAVEQTFTDYRAFGASATVKVVP